MKSFFRKNNVCIFLALFAFLLIGKVSTLSAYTREDYNAYVTTNPLMFLKYDNPSQVPVNLMFSKTKQPMTSSGQIATINEILNYSLNGYRCLPRDQYKSEANMTLYIDGQAPVELTPYNSSDLPSSLKPARSIDPVVIKIQPNETRLFYNNLQKGRNKCYLVTIKVTEENGPIKYNTASMSTTLTVSGKYFQILVSIEEAGTAIDFGSMTVENRLSILSQLGVLDHLRYSSDVLL